MALFAAARADVLVTVEVLTDFFSPVDTSWEIRDACTNAVVASAPLGSFGSESCHESDHVVPDGSIFTILDVEGDGLTFVDDVSPVTITGDVRLYINGEVFHGSVALHL